MTRILIADDNSVNRYLLESILKSHQFNVTSTKNGADALKAALENPPDLIVSDILMPVMDGFELCRQWKAQERLKSVPFVFFTATYTDTKDMEFALSLGADRFVTKPTSPDVIVQAIKELLAEFSKNGSVAKEPSIDEAESQRLYNEVLFRKLEKKVSDLEHEVATHKKAEERVMLANRKLALLSGISRHDINNQILILDSYLELLHKEVPHPELDAWFTRISKVTSRISSMIQFTKEYEQLGRSIPTWQNCRTLIETAKKEIHPAKILIQNDLPADAEVLADPLIVKVFYNLIDNAQRYGGKITTIRFSEQEQNSSHFIVCEDDGDGVPASDKKNIFEKGFGKNTGLGLTLAREILDITAITIKETGEPGKGARFEIHVPKGAFRFSGKR